MGKRTAGPAGFQKERILNEKENHAKRTWKICLLRDQ